MHKVYLHTDAQENMAKELDVNTPSYKRNSMNWNIDVDEGQVAFSIGWW